MGSQLGSPWRRCEAIQLAAGSPGKTIYKQQVLAAVLISVPFPQSGVPPLVLQVCQSFSFQQPSSSTGSSPFTTLPLQATFHRQSSSQYATLWCQSRRGRRPRSCRSGTQIHPGERGSIGQQCNLIRANSTSDHPSDSQVVPYQVDPRAV